MTDRPRDAYRERVPAPDDLGVLHGPLRRNDAFFGASVPLEYISERLREIDRALNDDALLPPTRWEWERLVREYEIRREALRPMNAQVGRNESARRRIA